MLYAAAAVVLGAVNIVNAALIARFELRPGSRSLPPGRWISVLSFIVSVALAAMVAAGPRRLTSFSVDALLTTSQVLTTVTRYGLFRKRSY